ncbi:MAG: LysM peptidoglycan-binding domain-containing protein [Phycisphaerales bacterium]|nr:LysM peptidoglycan-binding domain-containing protein [Phycisphaerales bacterium]
MTTGGKFILLAAVAAVVLLIVFYGGGPVPASASVETAKAPPAIATAPNPIVGKMTINTPTSSPTIRSPEKPLTMSRVAEVSQPLAQAVDQAAVVEMGKNVPASVLPTKINSMPQRSTTTGRLLQPKVPVRPPAPSARPTRVTIRSGDTLTSIAARTLGNGNKWQQLLDANPKIDPRSLRVGGTLRIPTITPSRPVARVATPSLPGRRHRVGEGDTLSSIAIDYYGDSQRWSEIFEANRAALGGDPNRLVLDVVLVVP